MNMPNKKETLALAAMLRYVNYRDRIGQLAIEKGKADMARRMRRLVEMRADKESHKLN